MKTLAVSAIVVSFNTRDLLRECLASLERHLATVSHELIVIDNASADGSAEMVASEFPAARVLQNLENVGFGRANNQGMQVAAGELFLLLNSDARLLDGSLLRLAQELVGHPEIGVVGPRLLRPDGTLQHSAYRFGRAARIAVEELGLYKLLSRERRANLLLGGYWDHSCRREVDWLVGACLLVRREAFERTLGFDPTIFLYGEEEEWCERIRQAGFDVVFSPNAQVEHIGHVSAQGLLGEEGRLRRCLAAADALVRRREGALRAALLRPVRLTGALLRLAYFELRQLARGPDEAGRTAIWTARVVLRYCLRPGAGRA